MKKIIEYYIANVPHKGKRHTVRSLLKWLPLSHVKSFYGPIIKCNARDKTNVYAISGEYGRIISDHIEGLPEDSIFIDIGANCGIFSFLAAAHLTKGKVVSFEPNPEIYRFFIDNLKLNAPDNLIAMHCAVGESDGLLELETDARHSGKTHIKLSPTAACAGKYYTVPAYNIATLEQLKTIVANNQTHIKIDVEGYEANIISALLRAPWFDNVCSITVEIDADNLSVFNKTPEEIYAALDTQNFTPKFGLQKDQHYDEIFIKNVA